MADNSPNFAELLDTNADAIERPKPLPVGGYSTIVTGAPVYDKSSKKGTPYVQFTLKPVAALDDVDENDLNEAGGLENKTIRATYYLTEDAAFRLKDFLEHCGIDMAGKTLRGGIEEAMNCTVGAVIRHRPSEDGTTIFAELARTMPIE